MDYFLSLAGIVMVNILLSGDNALVIALASRNLAPDQQKKAMLWGSAGAIGLRIILTFGAVLLLQIPYLQLIGGLLLLWIAVKIIGSKREEHNQVEAKQNLLEAIRTVILADLVMSLDNVLAIAGVAKGNISLLVVGLAISIPLILWGSKAIGALMEKWPIIITLGSAFLGWTAGEMILGDKMMFSITLQYPWLSWVIPGTLAVIVVIVGKVIAEGKQKVSK